MDRDSIRATPLSVRSRFLWNQVSIRVIMPGCYLRRRLTPWISSFSAGVTGFISGTEVPRLNDRRLTSEGGGESDPSEDGGVRGYSISELPSSE